MFVRAMLWKEFREHRVQAAIFAALSVGVVVAASLLDPELARESFRTMLSATFAWACGMVTGAILLANESESMTQVFLDHLPRSRQQVWWAKLAFGLALTLMQAGILFGSCMFLRQSFSSSESAPVTLVAIVLGGLFGLCCGLFGSALGGNVLSAVGWSVVGMFLTLILGWVFSLLLSIFAWDLELSNEAEPALMFLAFVAAMPIPLAISSWVYTRLDRERAAASGVRSPRRFHFGATWLGLRQTLWLSLRQGRGLFLFLAIVAMIGSVALIAVPFATWPILTLLIGLLAGVGIVGDEQYYGSFRFLAEQRIPLGRFWFTKVASRFAVAVMLVMAMLLAAGLGRAIAREIAATEVNARLRDQGWKQFVDQIGAANVLGAWFAYGFAFGHVAGLFARKSFVAFALGLVGSVSCLLLWFPSMLGGGLPWWQVFLIPVGLLLLAKLMLWKWATERLYSARAWALTTAFALGAIGFITMALCNRVWEAPAIGEPFDVASFEFEYPPRAENDVRTKLFQAVELFNTQRINRPEAFDERDSRVFAIEQQKGPRLRLQDRISIAIATGWPKNDPELEANIDVACGGGWVESLKEAAALPASVVDDPRDLAISPPGISSRLFTPSRYAAARALEIQARGNDGEALDLIATLLAVTRHAQTRSTLGSTLAAIQIERNALDALETWSNRPGVSQTLLEKALAMVREHESKRPPIADNLKAEFIYHRDFLAIATNPYRERASGDWGQYLAVAANLAPWERARRQRLVNACFDLMMQETTLTYPEMLARCRVEQTVEHNVTPIAWAYRMLPVAKDDAGEEIRAELAPMVATELILRTIPVFMRSFEIGRYLSICRVRAAQIRLALLIHQHRHGKTAERLDQLVPGILPAVPIDPYSEQPFRYRAIGQEEWLAWTESVFPGDENWGVADTVAPGPPGAMPAGIGIPGAAMGAALPTRFRPTNLSDEHASFRRLLPGYGVIWSVGADGVDDGGRARQESFDHPSAYVREPRPKAGDLLFVTPKIKKSD